MKIKSLVLGMAAAMMVVSVAPVVSAQDSASGSEGPQFSERGNVQGFRATMRPGGPRRGLLTHRRGNPERLLDRVDANEDGVLDENEFVDSRVEHVDRTFTRRDDDGDGLLSREELERKERPDRPEFDREAVKACVREIIADYDPEDDFEERFDNIDTNDDGFIDLVELSVALQERSYVLFDRLDADDDGVLTLEEITAGHKHALNVRRIVRYCIDQVTDPFATSTDL